MCQQNRVNLDEIENWAWFLRLPYDESGNKFDFVLISILFCILAPITFLYWPRKNKIDPNEIKKLCQCPKCIEKREIIESAQSRKAVQSFVIKLCLSLGWIVILHLAERISKVDYEIATFDPFDILKILPNSSLPEIKKAYRERTLILHPDKRSGNNTEFFLLRSAYEALTDKIGKENYQIYGHPDGITSFSYGVSIPSWVINTKNKYWTIALYQLMCVLALPIFVKIWWKRSIKYSAENVFLQTSEMYTYIMKKYPQMFSKGVLLVLSGSSEFDKTYNPEAFERETDIEEVQALIGKIPKFSMVYKAQPFCRFYSTKARVILYAHLSRIPLSLQTLEKDRQLIVQTCPYLIKELYTCAYRLGKLSTGPYYSPTPGLDNIENIMKVSAMITQALWSFKSPLLQLPHFTEDLLKSLEESDHLKTLQDLARKSSEERRELLRSFSDFEYEDVVKVLSKIPLVEMKVNFEVLDDKNEDVITAGSIVTVTVTLIRKDMKTLFEETLEENHSLNLEDIEETVETFQENSESLQKRSKTVRFKNKLEYFDFVEPDNDEEDLKDSESDCSDEDSSVSDDFSDDEAWLKYKQKEFKEQKPPGRSPVVHCPYFPEEKHEHWWLYLCDRNDKTFLANPSYITDLFDKAEIVFQFIAPNNVGLYDFSVCLRSDSYLGLDLEEKLQLDVQKSFTVPIDHPTWDIFDVYFEDLEDHIVVSDQVSEYATDSSDEEETYAQE